MSEDQVISVNGIRLLFTHDQIEHFYFYWFTMEDEEFYWGSPYQSYPDTISSTKTIGNQMIIKIDPNYAQETKNVIKYSWHKSGAFHYKNGTGKGSYKLHPNFGSKTDIKSPKRFFAIHTRALKFYDKKINSPVKRKFNPFIIGIKDCSPDTRMIFEFFLSPLGTFELPAPLFPINGPDNIFCCSLSNELILVVRSYLPEDQKRNIYPEMEIKFIYGPEMG